MKPSGALLLLPEIAQLSLRTPGPEQVVRMHKVAVQTPQVITDAATDSAAITLVRVVRCGARNSGGKSAKPIPARTPERHSAPPWSASANVAVPSSSRREQENLRNKAASAPKFRLPGSASTSKRRPLTLPEPDRGDEE